MRILRPLRAPHLPVVCGVLLVVAWVGCAVFDPPDHTWMRVAVASDLTPQVTLDPASRLPVFRVALPDTFDNFDPDVPWFALVIGCFHSGCTDTAAVQWRIDTTGRTLTHHHWRTPSKPDEFVVRYGAEPPGWRITQAARRLEDGKCYFVVIRVDNRAARAAFRGRFRA